MTFPMEGIEAKSAMIAIFRSLLLLIILKGLKALIPLKAFTLLRFEEFEEPEKA